MKVRPLMIGLGEVLWDLLPSGKMLGGAPANFAYMANVFGNRGVVASRLGDDEFGREACEVMTRQGLNTTYVQCDARHATGTAGVHIDSAGQPKFRIAEPAAWDFLEWTPQWGELSSEADVICFGSLAQRSPQSAATIERFLKNARADALKICDANLREPFFDVGILRRSFRYADVLKLNDHELFMVASLLNLQGGDVIRLAREIFDLFSLRLVCITKGANGSLLISEDQVVEHPGVEVEVADTVGAGDAFTACVAHSYIQGRPLEEISESANRLAAWVSSQVGATPPVSQSELFGILAVDATS